MDQAEKNRLYNDIRDIQRKQGVLVEHAAVQAERAKSIDDKLDAHLKWHESLKNENTSLKSENKKMIAGIVIAIITALGGVITAIVT